MSNENEEKECGCGCHKAHHVEHHHNHKHKEEKESCGCHHDHEHKEDKESCGCHHNHEHKEDKESCGCHHHHTHEEHEHEEECGCGCGCGHDHEHGGTVEKKEILKLIIGAVIFIAAVLTENFAVNLSDMTGISLGTVETISLVLYLVSYFTVGGEVVMTAAKNIRKGKVFDENFLMGIATVGAFFIGEYPEAVAVMMFYQVGEMFQSYAVGKSRRSITALMDIRPDVAYVKLDDGSVVKRDPKDVRIGEIIVVKPGEKVALDGKLAKGEGTIDTMALTGESLPREVFEGDNIISGSISVSGVLEIEVEKEFGQSTVAKILELAEKANQKKAKTEKFITKFARYYTPAVVYFALALAILPPVIQAFRGITGADVWSEWIYRALSFLVISCPCALVISVPLTFFAGIGGASSKGILVKGSSYLEALAECSAVVFDKTGTLTKGNFKVSKIQAASGEEADSRELLIKATKAELFSNHPIALSLRNQLMSDDREIYDSLVKNADSDGYEEISGYGIKADVGNEIIYAGNAKLMDKFEVEYKPVEEIGTVVYVASKKSDEKFKYVGYIVISDEIKEDAKEAIEALKALGVKKTVMLTGDRKNIAEHVGKILGIEKICSELLPGDKVEKVEELLDNKSDMERIAFAGDGINDAPVLARADIGIAMGGLGQDAAIEAADVVIMDDKPSNIAKAIKIARRTMGIVKQNIVFAIGVKLIVLALAAVGIASMWYAVFADVGVCVIAILNALRAQK